MIKVKRWYANVSYTQLMSYYNKCNSDEVLGFPKHSLLITGIAVQPKTEKGWVGHEVDWELEHKPLPDDLLQLAPGQTGGWRPTALLNVGWNVYMRANEVLDEDGNSDYDLVKTSAKSVYGENLASPVKLGVNGEPLAADADPTYVFRSFYGEIKYDLIVN